jgi:hypothetical protein
MAAPKRILSDSEKQYAEQAKMIGRPFANVSIKDGLSGWIRDGDECFHVESHDGKPFLTSKGRKGKGRIYQSFAPKGAQEIAFTLAGKADINSCYVALWNGETLVRKMTAGNNEKPFRVRWEIESAGELLTLEVVDKNNGEDGYLAVSELELTRGR